MVLLTRARERQLLNAQRNRVFKKSSTLHISSERNGSFFKKGICCVNYRLGMGLDIIMRVLSINNDVRPFSTMSGQFYHSASTPRE